MKKKGEKASCERHMLSIRNRRLWIGAKRQSYEFFTLILAPKCYVTISSNPTLPPPRNLTESFRSNSGYLFSSPEIASIPADVVESSTHNANTHNAKPQS